MKTDSEQKAAQGRVAAHITEWLKLCAGNAELVANYDRLKGTNISLKLDALSNVIDQTTGKFEKDAEDFFDFCIDLYWRIDPPK